MSRHLKRYAAPRSWSILRKQRVFTQKPLPGKHPLDFSVPLGLMLKTIGIASTQREITKMLLATEILVDGKRVKESATGIGFMDIITIKQANLHYRVILDRKGRLQFSQLKQAESAKPCKIVSKKIVGEKKIQICLFDGRTLLIENDVKSGNAGREANPASIYKVGDTLVIEVPSQKIEKHLKMEKGANVFFVEGEYKGRTGTIDEIHPKKIICHGSENEKIEAPKSAVFVMPK